LHDAPVTWTLERAGWFRQTWLGRSDDAWAELLTRGQRVVQADGAVLVRRGLSGMQWAQDLTADHVHVGDQDLLQGPLEQWWLELHLVDGRVFGTIGPTQARAGLAVAGALCGMVACGQARVWLDWRVGWSLRDDVVERDGALPIGVKIGVGVAPPPIDGVEAILWRALGEAGADLRDVVASCDPGDGGHFWLSLRDVDDAKDRSGAVLSWITDEPDVSATIVREVLRGLGVGL
jgi:hypothetical protein